MYLLTTPTLTLISAHIEDHVDLLTLPKQRKKEFRDFLQNCETYVRINTTNPNNIYYVDGFFIGIAD